MSLLHHVKCIRNTWSTLTERVEQ